MPYVSLTRKRLHAALSRLSELAQAEGRILEVTLYGGAVFTLVYGSRESTKDVDALFQDSEAARRLASIVAREQDLPEDWLNDDVRQFLSDREEKRRVQGLDFGPGLKVTAPTANYLLALKLRASRPRLPGYAGDEEDIAFLLRKIRPASYAEVQAIFECFFPHDTLPDRTQFLIERILKENKS